MYVTQIEADLKLLIHFPFIRFDYYRTLPWMTRQVYWIKQEPATLTEHQSLLPFHWRSMMFICIYICVFCRSSLVVGRFSVFCVYRLPLDVNHWLPLRLSVLFFLVWINEALEIPNQFACLSHTGRESQGHIKIKMTRHILTCHNKNEIE